MLRLYGHMNSWMYYRQTGNSVKTPCCTQKNQSWNMDLCNHILRVFYIRLNQEMNMQNFLDAFQHWAQILFCIHKPLSKRKIVFFIIMFLRFRSSISNLSRKLILILQTKSPTIIRLFKWEIYSSSHSLTRSPSFKAFFMLRAVLVKWMCTLKSGEHGGNCFF